MASDLSAFHRIDDMGALDASTFFRLAYRLKHYRGVMRDIMQAVAEGSPAQPQLHQQAPARPAEIPVATKATVQADPLLSQWIGFS